MRRGREGGDAPDGRGGFTLLELLVAAAIVAAASIVVLGGFAAGIRVWERAREFSGREVAARIAMAAVSKDLCNRIPCRVLSFRGSDGWLEIPSVTGEGGAVPAPGIIRYEFSRGEIRRYAMGMEGERGAAKVEELMLTGVREVSVLYGDAGEDGRDSVTWQREWMGRTNLPVAVRMAVRFPGGEGLREIRKTVILPRGYPIRDERR